MKGAKKKTSDHIIRVLVIITLVSAMVLVALMGYQSRQSLIYAENLDKTAVKVGVQELTLKDLAFYVLYEEHSVEEKARVYDEENPMSFWNVHTNQVFIKLKAQETAMDMAVHDYLFYDEALKCGMALTEEEKELLESRRTDFWEDLYDEQKENLPVSYETINAAMGKIALAEKFQQKMAVEQGTTYAAYSYDGYDYEQWLKENDIKVKVNHKVWDRINFGNITLVHDEQISLGDEK